MSRAQIVLLERADRERAVTWIKKARPGSRVEFKGPQRSLPQNDRFYAMLTDLAIQHRISGQRYTVDQWKLMVLHACAKERGEDPQYLPPLNGGGMIQWGRSSSDLSVSEMTEVIEWMFSFGAENGIAWSDPKPKDHQPEENAA